MCCWPEIQGADELLRRFGHYPTFHDAHILCLSFTDSGTTITGQFYVYEEPVEGLAKQDWDNDLHLIVELKWTAVQSLTLAFTDNWLDSLSLERREQNLESTLVDMESGEAGVVVSESMQVQRVDEPPGLFQRTDGSSIKTLYIRALPNALES